MDNIRLWAVSLSALLTLSCSWQQRTVQYPEPAAIQGAKLPPLAEQLPPLPDPRSASIVFVSEINGADALSRSVNAIDSGTALDLYSASNAISYGIWQFSPALHRLESIQAVLSLPPGDKAYVALGDYLSGAWELAGPFSAGVVLPLDEARHKSAGGNCCVAVICASGDSAKVHKLVLTANFEWQVLTVDSGGNVGSYTSLAVIDGNPAISYCEDIYQGVNDALWYVRAADALGESWSTPQQLKDGAEFYGYTSLRAVHGNPAVSFEEATYFPATFHCGSLMYMRAHDAAGANWGSPLNLDSDSFNNDYRGDYSSLAIVGGVPAIAYCGAMGTKVKYKQASDVDGGAWEPAEQAGTGKFSSLEEDSDGQPAICFYGTGPTDLLVVGPKSGGGWNTPLAVDASADDVGQYCSTIRDNGELAVCYYNATRHDLLYARYNKSSYVWERRTLDSAGDVGTHTSLATIGGLPAVSYYDATKGDLKFMIALNDRGTAWASPVTVDSNGSVGAYNSLAEVDGKPAISYYDQTNRDLKYAIRLGP